MFIKIDGVANQGTTTQFQRIDGYKIDLSEKAKVTMYYRGYTYKFVGELDKITLLDDDFNVIDKSEFIVAPKISNTKTIENCTPEEVYKAIWGDNRK